MIQGINKIFIRIKKIMAKEKSSYDISEITGYPEWYVDQVSYWCFIQKIH